MPVDVEMPDGTVIEDVPDGTPKDVIYQKWQAQTKKPTSKYALEPPAQYVVDTAANLPKSLIGLVGDTAKAIYSPAETVSGLRSTLRGALANTLPEGAVEPYEGIERDKAIAGSVGGSYSQRYGGLRNILNTVREDPAGAAADVSFASMLAGAPLRAAGATRAADVATKISETTDPFLQSARAAKAVVAPAYTHIVGKTTGLGPHVIAEQLKGTPEFQAAMNSLGNKLSGKDALSEAQVVDKADDALSRIKANRGASYRAELANLKGVDKEIPITDIKAKADNWISERFNVKVKEDGSFDFSRSPLSGTSATDVENIYKIVQDWGSKAKDTTPAMLDILKRKLDDFYSTSRESRAMVQDLKQAVKAKIVSEVPEYAKMTANYEKATSIIKEMERALGAGDRASADTAIRRLTMAMREDKSFRRDLLKIMDETGEGNVTASVAGVVSKPVFNRSLESLAAAGGVGAAALFSNPYLAALLPLASPRVVGELNVVLGKIGRAAPYGRGAGLLAYQAGNIQNEELNGN